MLHILDFLGFNSFFGILKSYFLNCIKSDKYFYLLSMFSIVAIIYTFLKEKYHYFL